MTADIGPAVKQRRKQLGFTLADLAKRAGVSQGMLSEVEGGKKNPTLRVALQIATGLDCHLSELIADPEPPQNIIQRAAERKVFIDEETNARREVLAPLLVSRGIQVIRWTIPPNVRPDPFPADRPGTLEHITVLDGSVLVSAGGSEQTVLEVGDSITYQADMPRMVHNPTDSWSTILMLNDSTRVRSLNGSPDGTSNGSASAPSRG